MKYSNRFLYSLNSFGVLLFVFRILLVENVLCGGFLLGFEFRDSCNDWYKKV